MKITKAILERYKNNFGYFIGIAEKDISLNMEIGDWLNCITGTSTIYRDVLCMLLRPDFLSDKQLDKYALWCLQRRLSFLRNHSFSEEAISMLEANCKNIECYIADKISKEELKNRWVYKEGQDWLVESWNVWNSIFRAFDISCTSRVIKSRNDATIWEEELDVQFEKLKEFFVVKKPNEYKKILLEI